MADVIIIDDTPEILEIKTKLFKEAGFDVGAFEYAHNVLDHLSRLPQQQHPLAIITDTEMPYITGPEIMLYLSPQTNSQDKIISNTLKRVEKTPFYQPSRPQRLEQYVRGKYSGKLILTSRQKLEPQSIDDTLPDKAKEQLTVFNEALRISNGRFKIDADGIGMDSLIDYLRK